MRKFLKNSILEIFQTMYEAHVSIKKMIDKKDFENVQVLLEDCQNTAVQIGTSIESSEGEGFVTVGYLEEYCEAVYEVATNISDEYSGNKAQKVLDKKLIKAENSVKNNVKVRLEIVFCPYKASMWDSLESVWKAADEDPDCDAYVVPIPYYDRNPDYSFGEFHYEGGDYPDYVPITHYEVYNFEARRPDVIYIHNPYDDCNYVTSVDPRFYSSELKKYTDNLVYVPYCVYDEPQSTTDLNTLTFFKRYITPVIFNADYIIFQSENFCRTFLNMISSYSNIDKSVLAKKILDLGSPKYDKVNKAISDSSITNTWKDKIFSDNGNRKKVIFYNTSIGMLLEYSEKMIDKIKNVIAYSEDHKNEFVLLWRPHPLIEATIKSMRPDLWIEYKRIIDDFVKKDMGIYDDTPDYSTGFSVSDAYYGDFSSLVKLYQATGKLLMTQDASVTDHTDHMDNLITGNMYCDGKYIWATAMNYNALYRIDPITFNAEFIGIFPDEELNGYFLYFGIEEKDGKLYFCPSNAGSIGILDKETLQISCVKVKTQNDPRKGNYYGISSFEDNIIIAGNGNNSILLMDTKSLEVKYINACVLLNNTVQDKSDSLVRHLCKLNDKFYTISQTKNSLLSFNPANRQSELLSLPESIIDSSSLYCSYLYSDGLSLWLIQPYQENVFRINPLTGNVLQTIPFAKEAKIIIVSQFIYLFSSEKSICCRIDINTYESTIINIGVKANYVYNFGDKIIIINSLEKDITVLNIDTFECTKTIIRSNPLDLERYSIADMFRSFEKQMSFVRESSFFSLDSLLIGINQNTFNTNDRSDKTIGAKIHETIKEKL